MIQVNNSTSYYEHILNLGILKNQAPIVITFTTNGTSLLSGHRGATFELNGEFN